MLCRAGRVSFNRGGVFVPAPPRLLGFPSRNDVLTELVIANKAIILQAWRSVATVRGFKLSL